MSGLAHVSLLLCALTTNACRDNVLVLPPTMLWAWNRDEDLRFLAGQPDVGVAYLAAIIDVSGEHVGLQRRHVTLQLASTTVRLPVLRIEPDFHRGAVLDAPRRTLIVRMIRAEVDRAGMERVQLDFEATASQRDFYRALLSDLRTTLGPRMRISITALGSWCVGDRWMRGLPVDEIVPMFYRLGPEGVAMHADLARGHDLATECRLAHAFITDEPIVPPPTPRRAYLFSTKPWTKTIFERQMLALKGPS